MPTSSTATCSRSASKLSELELQLAPDVIGGEDGDESALSARWHERLAFEWPRLFYLSATPFDLATSVAEVLLAVQLQCVPKYRRPPQIIQTRDLIACQLGDFQIAFHHVVMPAATRTCNINCARIDMRRVEIEDAGEERILEPKIPGDEVAVYDLNRKRGEIDIGKTIAYSSTRCSESPDILERRRAGCGHLVHPQPSVSLPASIERPKIMMQPREDPSSLPSIDRAFVSHASGESWKESEGRVIPPADFPDRSSDGPSTFVKMPKDAKLVLDCGEALSGAIPADDERVAALRDTPVDISVGRDQ
jgi:hypothetical protein